MSEVYKKRLEAYKESIKEKTITTEDFMYLYNKKLASKIVDKEDIISKNKTERLIRTFMTLEDKFNDISILTNPFIEDENLIVKINNKQKTKVLKK